MRPRSVVVSESNFDSLVVPIMLIWPSRPAPMPACTNAASKYRVLAPATQRGLDGVEPANVGSQTDRICGLITCTRPSSKPSVCT